MNGGYTMIDLGTFGFNNDGELELSKFKQIENLLGKKPFYFTFHRVDDIEGEEEDMGSYVFFANVYSNTTHYIIPVVTYGSSDGDDITNVMITIKKANKEIKYIETIANYTE